MRAKALDSNRSSGERAMDTNQEIQGLEAELTFIQDEINRRHARMDQDFDRARNLEKIEELRIKKNKLQERIDKLKSK